MDTAVSANYLKWELTGEQQMMVGFGSYDATIDTLEKAVTGRRFFAGDRFSAADVYVGSQIDWGLQFGTMPKPPAFEAYVIPQRERAPYRKAKARDHALMPPRA